MGCGLTGAHLSVFTAWEFILRPPPARAPKPIRFKWPTSPHGQGKRPTGPALNLRYLTVAAKLRWAFCLLRPRISSAARLAACPQAEPGQAGTGEHPLFPTVQLFGRCGLHKSVEVRHFRLFTKTFQEHTSGWVLLYNGFVGWLGRTHTLPRAGFFYCTYLIWALTGFLGSTQIRYFFCRFHLRTGFSDS